ncbi:MAG: 3-hydroxybutyryl-CoA dehydrogenase [Planctomycetota bacterium]|nr:MAG: 3-hydroxybutyryl-CoA dehydrogenase [Planctomycetota bacterium]
MAIAKVAVIGCGLMGSGIAEICAKAGLKTVVREVSEDFLKKGAERIQASLAKAMQRAIEKEKQDPTQAQMAMAQALGCLQFTTRLEDCKDADLVIEAIIEDKTQKQDLFKQLDALCKPGAIICTNTSNISITELGAVTKRADKFAGLHFFNPVPVMKLVEVIKGVLTSDATLSELKGFAEKVGKTSIIAKDTCGFVVNVLLVPYLFDAIRLVENGVASIRDIDTGMKLGCGYPMGPLELLDFVGIDTTYHISVNMFEEFKSDRYAAPPLLKKMHLAGLHGRKTGKGFYDYTDPKNPVPMKLV